jgi:hypothetical protein
MSLQENYQKYSNFAWRNGNTLLPNHVRSNLNNVVLVEKEPDLLFLKHNSDSPKTTFWVVLGQTVIAIQQYP